MLEHEEITLHRNRIVDNCNLRIEEYLLIVGATDEQAGKIFKIIESNLRKVKNIPCSLTLRGYLASSVFPAVESGEDALRRTQEFFALPTFQDLCFKPN